MLAYPSPVRAAAIAALALGLALPGPAWAASIQYRLKGLETPKASALSTAPHNGECSHQLMTERLVTRCKGDKFHFVAVIDFEIAVTPRDPARATSLEAPWPEDTVEIKATAKINGTSTCCHLGSGLRFELEPPYGRGFSEGAGIGIANTDIPSRGSLSAADPMAQDRNGSHEIAKTLRVALPTSPGGIRIVIKGPAGVRAEYVYEAVEVTSVAIAPGACTLDDDAARLVSLREEAIALGQGLRRLSEVDLPARSIDKPELKICIQDGVATMEHVGWANWISENANFANAILGVVSTGFSANALRSRFPNLAGILAPDPSILDGPKVAGTTIAAGVGVLLAGMDIIRGKIIQSKQGTSLDPEAAFADYQAIYAAYREASQNTLIMRREMICRIKEGVPQFYELVHQIEAEAARLRQEIATGTCFANDDQRALARRKVDLLASNLRSVYEWHAEGMYKDTARGAPTGYVTRGTWVEKAGVVGGVPIILAECDR